jgi:hypothetical protein
MAWFVASMKSRGYVSNQYRFEVNVSTLSFPSQDLEQSFDLQNFVVIGVGCLVSFIL